jgi:hypothetical protein
LEEIYSYKSENASERLIGKWSRINADGDIITLELNKDGTFLIISEMESIFYRQLLTILAGNGFEGTWKLISNNLHFSLDSAYKGLASGFPWMTRLMFSAIGSQKITLDEFFELWNKT